MSTPFPSRQPAPKSWTDQANHPAKSSRPCDWRCTQCAKLLGVCRDGRIHLRFSRGHEYFAGYPITATCRDCGTLNEASAPTR